MFSIVGFIINDESQVNQRIMRVERRILRDYFNPLDEPDSEFRENYRVSKEIFKEILNTVSAHMKKIVRSTAILPILKLASFLRFLATGSYQKPVGNDYTACLAQSTVSSVISECLDIFETHFCNKWIQLQRTIEEERTIKDNFFRKFGFPGIVGCVDGTHVRICSPGGDIKHLYYNRKGYYSLNVMVICDHNLSIQYVNAKNAGANHDAFIWRYSSAHEYFKNQFDNGKRNTWVLGDAGYQLQPFLMTPFRSPGNEFERLYNDKHSKARNVVERCFGVLKNRFRCLLSERGLHYSPHKAVQIVNACCSLHNICIQYRYDYWREVPMSEVPQIEEYNENESSEFDSQMSVEIRRRLAENLV